MIDAHIVHTQRVIIVVVALKDRHDSLGDGQEYPCPRCGSVRARTVFTGTGSERKRVYRCPECRLGTAQIIDKGAQGEDSTVSS